MSNVYELGDLLVTREYDNKERIEVCIFKGQTGSLFYCLTETLIYHKERFVGNHESMARSTRVIRANKSAEYLASIFTEQPTS